MKQSTHSSACYFWRIWHGASSVPCPGYSKMLHCEKSKNFKKKFNIINNFKRKCIRDLHNCPYCYCEIDLDDSYGNILRYWSNDNDFWGYRLQYQWYSMSMNYTEITYEYEKLWLIENKFHTKIECQKHLFIIAPKFENFTNTAKISSLPSAKLSEQTSQ